MRGISELINQAARYLADLHTAILKPEDIIKRASKQKTMIPSIRFFLWSIGFSTIVWSVIFGLRDPVDIVANLVKTALMGFLSLGLGIAHMGTWWLFGGKLKSQELFRVFAYISGTMIMLLIPFALAMFGSYWLLEEVSFRSKVMLAQVLLALSVINVWIRPAQQWFRQRQGLNRLLSFCAQTLALLSVPIFFLIYYIAYYGLVQMSR